MLSLEPSPSSSKQQVPTTGVSAEEIMSTAAFRQGVADMRAGRPPSFDGDFELMPLGIDPLSGDLNSFENRQWNYERGRQFAILAPRGLVVILPRAKKLNPMAVTFFHYFCGEVL